MQSPHPPPISNLGHPPDAAPDPHEADLEVAVAQVLEVEVDRDGLGLLALRVLVGRHVHHLRRDRPEVHLLEPESQRDGSRTHVLGRLRSLMLRLIRSYFGWYFCQYVKLKAVAVN